MNISSSTFRELAFKAAVVPRQESQVSLEALAPQDLQVLRDRPARKDPWDHVETKAKMAIQEIKASRAPRDLQGHWRVIGSSVCSKKDTGLIRVNIKIYSITIIQNLMENLVLFPNHKLASEVWSRQFVSWFTQF